MLLSSSKKVFLIAFCLPKVRDVSCKSCEAKVGWMYEFATEDNQRYKEGRVILERALVTESDGMEERVSYNRN